MKNKVNLSFNSFTAIVSLLEVVKIRQRIQFLSFLIILLTPLCKKLIQFFACHYTSFGWAHAKKRHLLFMCFLAKI